MPASVSLDGDRPVAADPLATSWLARSRRILFGAPRDLADSGLAHRLALAPVLAWIGLGADGLSSSSYGPEEAFRTLGDHAYLAVGLAAMTVLTITIISLAYSRIIEAFPHGGGGYVVASRLLGERIGLISGAALLVDYVLTITVSVAAAGDALFSLLPAPWHGLKIFLEVAVLVGLAILNIRGVRESVLALAPIFFVFLATHVVLIVGGLLSHMDSLPLVAQQMRQGWQADLSSLGLGGVLLVFVHAYSMGGGTYTGLEAVSNGLAIMREPRVRTARTTMAYMAISLAATAGGLLICYLLFQVVPVAGKTLNAVLLEAFAGSGWWGQPFVVLTLAAEGALLIVGAQTGYLDGPRVLANMAHDNWVPRSFGALSERLTTHRGVELIAVASVAALLYTHGDVAHLVVMYSINVFLTFSLSMFGMARQTLAQRQRPGWRRTFGLFAVGFALCVTILAITAVEKFAEGGWMTLVVTALVVALCLAIRRHYRDVAKRIDSLYTHFAHLPSEACPACSTLDPGAPTAAILVGGYGGLGIHTLLHIFRLFPKTFGNFLFLSVGVVDSGAFKGEGAVAELSQRTEAMLQRYVGLARSLGLQAGYRLAVGTDVVEESDKLCRATLEAFPATTFFAGKIVFGLERWYHRLLHNETAYAVQRRLELAGVAMVVVPAKV